MGHMSCHVLFLALDVEVGGAGFAGAGAKSLCSGLGYSLLGDSQLDTRKDTRILGSVGPLRANRVQGTRRMASQCLDQSPHTLSFRTASWEFGFE